MLIVGNGTLITADSGPIFSDGAVLTNGSVIMEIGEFRDLREKYSSVQIVDAQGGIIMPGLINFHANPFAVLYRWLDNCSDSVADRYYSSTLIRQKAERFLDLISIAAIGSAFAAECIKNGITSVFASFSAPHAVTGSLFALSSSLHEAGIRSCLGCEVSESGNARKTDAAIDENNNYSDYCKTAGDGLLASSFGISSPSKISDDTLSRIAAGNRTQVPYHIDAPKSVFDERDALIKHRQNTCSRLRSHNLLDTDTILYSPAELSAEDIPLILKCESTLVLSPRSNALDSLSSPSAFDLHGAGIRFALGTDKSGCDILAEAGYAFESELRSGRNEAKVLDALSSAMISYGGRFASGFFGSRIGVIAPGASADIVILNRYSLRSDRDHIFRFLIGECRGSDVSTVISAGKLVMHEGKLLTLDEKRIRAESKQVLESIIRNSH